MISNNRNRLFNNMFSYAVLQLVNLLVGLVLPRLLLSVYGSEINGVVSTVNSFTTYFSYLEAGLGITLIHSLFKPLSENNTVEINGILSYSKKQYQKISGIYFLLVIGISVLFPLTQTVDSLGTFEFGLLVFVMGVYGAMDFYTMAKYRVLLTADRKEYIISNAMTVAQLLRFLVVWLILQFNVSIVIIKTVPILTLLLRSLILNIYVKRKYQDVNFSVSVPIAISETSHRWDALLLQISINTSTALPTLIVSQVMGYREANVYAVYALVISAVISIVSALSSGVSPMLGRSLARGEDISHIYDLFEWLVTIVLTIVFSVTAVMLVPFIDIYTNVADDINYVYPIYAILFSVWAAIYSYRIPITAVINAAALYKENRVTNIINLGIQIVVGILFAIIWGIPGLLIVMIISALQRNISFAYINSKLCLKNKVTKNLIRQALMIVLIVLIYVLCNNVISGIEFSMLSWFGIALILFLVVSVVCIPLFFITNRNNSKTVVRFLVDKVKK